MRIVFRNSHSSTHINILINGDGVKVIFDPRKFVFAYEFLKLPLHYNFRTNHIWKIHSKLS